MLQTINRCLYRIQQHRCVSVFCGLLSITLIIFLLKTTYHEDSFRNCFTHQQGKSKFFKLDDILESSRKPQAGRSIFFHETSCSYGSENVLSLSARQACAIESAALLNPNYDIFVLFASQTFLNNETTQPVLESILSYPNVFLRNLDLWTYSANTPIYKWLKNEELFSSKYVLSHISDFLRYLTLWRWGGTYLDLDVIVKKSLEDIPPNFAGAESDTFIAAGVINLEASGFGHDIAELCLRDFQIRFDGNDWGNNGPGVITRVLNKVCTSKSPMVMTRDRCFGFHVYSKEAFYAVRWWYWTHFFDEKYLENTLVQTKDSIVVHVWNKHSKNKMVKVGSNVAYGKLAEKFCPKVYSSCGDYF